MPLRVCCLRLITFYKDPLTTCDGGPDSSLPLKCLGQEQIAFAVEFSIIRFCFFCLRCCSLVFQCTFVSPKGLLLYVLCRFLGFCTDGMRTEGIMSLIKWLMLAWWETLPTLVRTRKTVPAVYLYHATTFEFASFKISGSKVPIF